MGHFVPIGNIPKGDSTRNIRLLRYARNDNCFE
jgi:hypothetical protein